MMNKSKRFISLSILSILTTTVFSFALINKSNSYKPALAAIDINDYTACEAKYEDEDASGLLSALRTITSPGSAKSYAELWNTYKTCYVREDGYMFDYYSNTTNYVPGGKQEGANYKKEGDSYNREHSIPKSWWGGKEKDQGADPYIVVPTDGYVNNRRDSYPFGMVSSVSYSSNNNFSKLGSANPTWGYTATSVFEPDNSVKGDFARIVFYAIAKYSGSYNWTKAEGVACFSGSASKNFGLTDYAVKLFSYWSNLDPVSDWERSVNDKVSAIQKNRNPFIDHPEYANVLWGDVPGYTNYGTKNVRISVDKLNLIEGRTATINAISSDSTGITWEVSDPNVVTLGTYVSGSGTNVTVNAVGEGNATITASSVMDGETYSDTLAVAVTKKTLSYITISGKYQTAFKPNDTYNHDGLVVTATYNNSTSQVVTDSCSFSTPDMSEAGNKTITISYTEGGVNKTTSYVITVDTLSHITATGAKTQFKQGDAFVTTGLIVTACYEVAVSRRVYDYTVSTPNMNVLGDQDVTVTYTENGETRTATYTITISESTEIRVQSVSLDKETLSMKVEGQYQLLATINPDNATNKKVTWTSDNPKVANVNNKGTVYAYSKGTSIITVTTQDGGFTATCTVTVTEPSSGGCGGNIVTSSIILSTLALAGASLLIIKRKKEQK